MMLSFPYLFKMSAADRDSIVAMVVFYGGRYNKNLDSSCTHLVAGKPTGVCVIVFWILNIH